MKPWLVPLTFLCFVTSITLYGQSGPNFINIRPLSEINSETSESYPYISCNGLKLFYLQGSLNGGQTKLKVCHWNSTLKKYGSPSNYDATTVNNGISSFWYSPGELEIFYIINQVLYRATRSTPSSSFKPPVIITLDGIPASLSGFISSPSVTVNDNPTATSPRELYLYCAKAGVKNIVKLTNPSATVNTYTYQGKLAIPEGYTVGSGQLSCDNSTSRYYLSLSCVSRENSKNISSTIYYISRTSMKFSPTLASISDFTPLVNQVSNASIMPTVSQPGTSTQTLVMVVNQTVASPRYSGKLSNDWNSNDLYLATFSTTPSFGNARSDSPEDLNAIYLSDPVPNPSPGEVIINYSIPLHCKGSVLLVYTIDGVMIESMDIDSEESSVLLNSLDQGLYFYSLKTSEGTQTKRLVIIK